MYFYHEHYHDAYAAALEDLRCRDARTDAAYEPIRIPAILNWLLAMSVALLVIVLTIQALS
jgi:hypothetical protein